MKRYNAPISSIPKRVPPEFAQVFVRGGWRLMERLYGARTDANVKWLEVAGAARLRQLRKAWLHGEAAALKQAAELDQRRDLADGVTNMPHARKRTPWAGTPETTASLSLE